MTIKIIQTLYKYIENENLKLTSNIKRYHKWPFWKGCSPVLVYLLKCLQSQLKSCTFEFFNVSQAK